SKTPFVFLGAVRHRTRFTHLMCVPPQTFTWREEGAASRRVFKLLGGTDERQGDHAAGDGRGICGCAHDARWADGGAGEPHRARRAGRTGLDGALAGAASGVWRSDPANRRRYLRRAYVLGAGLLLGAEISVRSERCLIRTAGDADAGA